MDSKEHFHLEKNEVTNASLVMFSVIWILKHNCRLIQQYLYEWGKALFWNTWYEKKPQCYICQSGRSYLICIVTTQELKLKTFEPFRFSVRTKKEFPSSREKCHLFWPCDGDSLLKRSFFNSPNQKLYVAISILVWKLVLKSPECTKISVPLDHFIHKIYFVPLPIVKERTFEV